MKAPTETRQQAFERLRKEYRSQMTEEDAIAIFDNTPNWLPDHLKALLPAETNDSGLSKVQKRTKKDTSQSVNKSTLHSASDDNNPHLDTIEKRLYPEGKPPAEPKTEPRVETTSNPNDQPQTKQEEKPGFWKRVWNWLGANWDKLLLGILIIGGFLWMIWKQYFAGDKKKKKQYQDEPAGRKKRSGFGSESFSMS
jgi:hypothetical protein